jgi:hypothetical protein
MQRSLVSSVDVRAEAASESAVYMRMTESDARDI